MAATRESVLSAIIKYVEDNGRRAPAKDIAILVDDKIINVQATIKVLVAEGAIEASRGRNGGALPDGMILPQKVKVAKQKPAKVEVAASTEETADDVRDQFAALIAQLDNEESQAVAV